MAKASVLTVRIPEDLKRRLSVVAEAQGVSLNQLAMYMFTREVGAFEAGAQLSAYWEGYDPERVASDFDEVMAKVKKRKPPKWDDV